MYKNYQVVNSVLYKFNIDESKHLLWKFGGVPALSCEWWDKNKHLIRQIKIRTNKRRTFTIAGSLFEAKKKVFHAPDFERQYYVEKELWDIKSPTTFKDTTSAVEETTELDDAEARALKMFNDI